MARISNTTVYTVDTEINGADRLLGTDAASTSAMPTRSYTIEDLRAFINDGAQLLENVPPQWVPVIHEYTGQESDERPEKGPFRIDKRAVTTPLVIDDGTAGRSTEVEMRVGNTSAYLSIQGFDSGVDFGSLVGTTFSGRFLGTQYTGRITAFPSVNRPTGTATPWVIDSQGNTEWLFDIEIASGGTPNGNLSLEGDLTITGTYSVIDVFFSGSVDFADPVEFMSSVTTTGELIIDGGAQLNSEMIVDDADGRIIFGQEPNRTVLETQDRDGDGTFDGLTFTQEGEGTIEFNANANFSEDRQLSFTGDPDGSEGDNFSAIVINNGADLEFRATPDQGIGVIRQSLGSYDPQTGEFIALPPGSQPRPFEQALVNDAPILPAGEEPVEAGVAGTIYVGNRRYTVPTPAATVATVIPGLQSRLVGPAGTTDSVGTFFYGTEGGNHAIFSQTLTQRFTAQMMLADLTIDGNDYGATPRLQAATMLTGDVTFLVDNEDDDQFMIRIFDQVPTAPTTRDPIRLMYLPFDSTIDFTMNNPATGMPWVSGVDRIDEDVYEVVGYQPAVLGHGFRDSGFDVNGAANSPMGSTRIVWDGTLNAGLGGQTFGNGSVVSFGAEVDTYTVSAYSDAVPYFTITPALTEDISNNDNILIHGAVRSTSNLRGGVPIGATEVIVANDATAPNLSLPLAIGQTIYFGTDTTNVYTIGNIQTNTPAVGQDTVTLTTAALATAAADDDITITTTDGTALPQTDTGYDTNTPGGLVMGVPFVTFDGGPQDSMAATLQNGAAITFDGHIREYIVSDFDGVTNPMGEVVSGTFTVTPALEADVIDNTNINTSTPGEETAEDGVVTFTRLNTSNLLVNSGTLEIASPNVSFTEVPRVNNAPAAASILYTVADEFRAHGLVTNGIRNVADTRIEFNGTLEIAESIGEGNIIRFENTTQTYRVSNVSFDIDATTRVVTNGVLTIEPQLQEMIATGTPIEVDDNNRVHRGTLREIAGVQTQVTAQNLDEEFMPTGTEAVTSRVEYLGDAATFTGNNVTVDLRALSPGPAPFVATPGGGEGVPVTTAAANLRTDRLNILGNLTPGTALADRTVTLPTNPAPGDTVRLINVSTINTIDMPPALNPGDIIASAIWRVVATGTQRLQAIEAPGNFLDLNATTPIIDISWFGDDYGWIITNS